MLRRLLFVILEHIVAQAIEVRRSSKRLKRMVAHLSPVGDDETL